MNAKLPVIAVVGPTAVGKTAFSIALAQRINGEIISGDSMQVYRHLSIGTAKATAEERQAVPHHLLDVCDESEAYNASQFQQQAQRCIVDISDRQRVPIVVALGRVGVPHRAACAHAWRQGRTSAVRCRDPAAHSLLATVVQPLGPSDGGIAVRHGIVS